MRKIVLSLTLILLILLVSCSHTEPLKVTEIEYVPAKMDLTGVIASLEAERPSEVPSFPAEIDIQNADDIEVYNYLANVISAYKTSLEAWQNYSQIQHNVLLALKEELQ